MDTSVRREGLKQWTTVVADSVDLFLTIRRKILPSLILKDARLTAYQSLLAEATIVPIKQAKR